MQLAKLVGVELVAIVKSIVLAELVVMKRVTVAELVNKIVAKSETIVLAA